MPKKSDFGSYQSPNIVIIPTKSFCYPPSPKRQKVEISLQQSPSPQHEDLSFLDDFNIDEIVECLNNCGDNDTTIQDLTDVGEVEKTSPQVTEFKIIVLSNENKTNTINNEIDLENTNVQNFTLDKNHGEHELQDKIPTTLKAENNVVISGTKPLEYVESNSQFASVVEETTHVQPPCTEAEHIEKDKICNSVELTYLNNAGHKNHIIEKDTNENDLDMKEFVDNKPIVLIESKKDTEENSSNNSHSKTKDIKNDTKEILENKDINANTVFEQNKSKAIAAPKSVIQHRPDFDPSKLLEDRMFNYLHRKFSLESVIHYGTFSKIFKCKDSAGEQYAVKMLNKQSDRFCLGIKKEKMFMDIQADIPKENLFCIYCVNSFSLKGYWCFLMEFYPKNLKQAILESSKPFHINLVQDFARQLVAAVTVLRNNNIVHSDIKPSHILLNSSKTIIKLCGFDRSYYINEAHLLPNMGSVNYRPPEIILGYSAGFSIDVWSTALVLHEMATGQQLFPGHYNCHILYKQICTLGSIPPEMLHGSCYRNRYFVGGGFKKKIGTKGEKTVLMYNLSKNDKLSRTVYGAYHRHWWPLRTRKQKAKDFKKIKIFLSLLEQMLVICPNYRINIEFVYANPFIYEMSD